MRKRNFVKVLFILIFMFLIAIILYLSWGSYKITPGDIIRTFLGHGTKMQKTALFSIRIPRMLVGISVAVSLSTAGALLQTITKNELADSGITGINAGAAVAAVVFISFITTDYYSELGQLSIYMLPFMAIIGAGISALFIYLLSSRDRIRPKRLLLVGLGLNAGLNAFLTFFMFKGGVGEYNRILTWTSGSLWGAGLSYAKIIVPVSAVLFITVLLHHKKLDVLMLSEEHGTALGLNLNKERRKFLLLTVLMAGGATAFAGNIGFLGLISPHIARRLVGHYHRHYLIISALISGVIVLVADAVSRNLFSPIEIPVGITISIFGVPYFIYLMTKEN
ncbi:FecCD family ABC transporter permease [Anaerocolumna sp.]|uniref:FecCD family ABC transporter permease n=1 Tax=Anaerocolumna sp. TaxID=2041569 RepID=UPI0028AF24B9|nr:iron ABC transporter permease [Anaerocolumna sp.]